MKLTTSARRLILLASAFALTACGVQPGRAPMAAVNQGGAVDAAAVEGSVAVAFNDTYLERIELNEPLARKNPKNTDKALLRLIKNAKTSIDGAFYDIEDLGVAEALVKAKKRGVTVRLVTDTDNMVEKTDPTKPRKAVMWLLSEGIGVIDDQRSGIMHHKFMVVDGVTVWTGSTNLTTTSLYRHNNNALTVQIPALAHAFTTEFERLFVKREFGKSMRGATLPTQEFPLGNGGTVQAFFSPAGQGREAVVAEVAKAQKKISFLTFWQLAFKPSKNAY